MKDDEKVPFFKISYLERGLSLRKYLHLQGSSVSIFISISLWGMGVGVSRFPAALVQFHTPSWKALPGADIHLGGKWRHSLPSPEPHTIHLFLLTSAYLGVRHWEEQICRKGKWAKHCGEFFEGNDLIMWLTLAVWNADCLQLACWHNMSVPMVPPPLMPWQFLICVADKLIFR